MNYERLRIELLKTKTDLAISKVKLEQAERDVARNTPLYREKLVSADIYEMAVSLRDALKAEVTEWGKAAKQIEERMNVLRSIGEPGNASAQQNDAWLTKLEAAQTAAIKNLEPHTLLAPITGMVSVPIRQSGEFVPAGEPLMTVSSTRADNVVAYLRQPYRFDPKVGMAARITTRTSQRQAFSTQITQIGAQVEVLTNALALMRPGTLVDAALPVILPVPSGVNIRPGEIVDVIITDPIDKSSITAAPSTAPHL
jgi:multidrug resistance efflux pump